MTNKIGKLWQDYNTTFKEIREIQARYDELEEMDEKGKQMIMKQLRLLHIRFRNTLRAISFEKSQIY